MKKASKDTGVSMSCPECKSTAFRNLVFEGNSLQEEIKCPHCGVHLLRVITKKTVITLTTINRVLFFAVLLVGIGIIYNIKNHTLMQAIGDFPQTILYK